ncbi:MAG TPA: hypothetical protein DCE55_17260 [Planctomycetaceae bacterium]|nr:hypothetical protein [Planctomycetaceae bacterium]
MVWTDAEDFANLRASSVSVLAVRWGHVSCLQRNGLVRQLRSGFVFGVFAIMAAVAGCASWQPMTGSDSELQTGSWSEQFRPRGERFGLDSRARQVEQNVGFTGR